MGRAAIYLRVSSQGQAEREIPIAGQERACREFAEREGLTVVAVYSDEGISGRTDQRPEFQRMVADAADGQFDVVIVWEISRLSRVAEHALAYCAKLMQDHGVDVRSVTQSFVLDTPIGKLMLTLLAGLAAFESDMISERTQRGMSESAKRGRRPGGAAPYGYRSVEARLVVRDDEAQVVRKMLSLIVDCGLGASAVASALDELGIRTRGGKSWTGTTVHQILCNPATRGHTVTHLYHSDPPERVEMRDTHQAIITDEEFARVGWRLEKPDYNRRRRPERKGKPMPPSKRSTYPLTGLLYCECGEPFVARGGRGRGGTYHRSYACRACNGGRRLRADEWEQKILAATFDAVLTPQAVSEAVEWWSGQRADHMAELRRSLASHESRIRELQRQVNNLANAIAEAGMAPATLVERIQATEVEIAVEEGEVLRIRTELAHAERPTQTAEDAVRSWCELMRQTLLDSVALQRDFLRTAVDRIEVPAEGPLVVHHRLLRPAEAKTTTEAGRGSSQLSYLGGWLRD